MNQQPMSTLAQLAELLLQNTQATLVGDGALAINRVHTDTRTLQAGDLFVALRGERFDANNFLEQARAAGAAAALCHPAHLQAMGWSGLEVSDTHQALQQLASAWRKQFALPLIAVTGSNGKTTVTQMVASILRVAASDAALATQGNLNNDIGVPLTLLRLRPTHKLAVVELGMNHPGEIAALAAMAAPTVALVNNAQREHQEFMGTVEAVAHENGQAIASLPANGIAVFPADDTFSPLWQHMAGQRQCLRFTLEARPPVSAPSCVADIYASALIWQGDHWQVQAHTPAGVCQFALHIAGKHNVKNALAAVACALAAGVSLPHIAQGLTASRGRAPVAERAAPAGATRLAAVRSRPVGAVQLGQRPDHPAGARLGCARHPSGQDGADAAGRRLPRGGVRRAWPRPLQRPRCHAAAVRAGRGCRRRACRRGAHADRAFIRRRHGAVGASRLGSSGAAAGAVQFARPLQVGDGGIRAPGRVA